ncbi:hypothetical protein V6N11_036834 [Hibiscus sabdariffa]|uniref:Uncharacterized protein n=1 Tax=Hibiscus sabdariffa TaxID=183260 RepID=A0ABR2RBI9_9ROSI
MPAARTGSACINAATLALEDAGIPMRYIVISCSAGYLNTTPVLGQLTSSIFGANKLIRLLMFVLPYLELVGLKYVVNHTLLSFPFLSHFDDIVYKAIKLFPYRTLVFTEEKLLEKWLTTACYWRWWLEK